MVFVNGGRRNTPVAKRGDEIEAAVNSVVDNVSTVQAALIVEVTLKLVVNVTDDGAEAGRGSKDVNMKPKLKTQHPNIKTEEK